MYEKRIITCALTGNWGQKHNNPNIPITPQEIHESADAAIAEGASVLHIHARDNEGHPTCSPERFAEIVNPIREKHPDIIINMTSSGEHSFTDIAPDDRRIAPFYHVKSYGSNSHCIRSQFLVLVYKYLSQSPNAYLYSLYLGINS